MSPSVPSVLLLAIAGFLVGGVYSFWRKGSRGPAILLALCAVLSLAGAVLVIPR